MNRYLQGGRIALAAAVACLIGTGAQAAFLLPSDGSLPFQWTRPANDGAATAGHTSYQQWEIFDSTTGPNVPDVAEINPNGTADAYDSASEDSGSFVSSSGNIYSFDEVIKPRAIVPSYNLAGGTVDFLVQVRSNGQEVHISEVTVNGVAIGSLSNYSHQELSRITLGGFGGDQVDHLWTFTLPADGAQFQLDWGWGESSIGLDRLSIDTRVSAALSVAGDFDDNGVVNAADIDILWHIVRGTVSDPGANDSADLDGNSLVNEDDVDLMLASKVPAGPHKYGDADIDADVDGADFDAWRLRTGYSGPGTGHWSIGDFDGDGDVDGADFDLWRLRPAAYPTNVGAHGDSLTAVPEPSALVLMALGLAALGLIPRRRR